MSQIIEIELTTSQLSKRIDACYNAANRMDDKSLMWYFVCQVSIKLNKEGKGDTDLIRLNVWNICSWLQSSMGCLMFRKFDARSCFRSILSDKTIALSNDIVLAIKDELFVLFPINSPEYVETVRYLDVFCKMVKLQQLGLN
ncbi:MAG: hypothetical protein KME64_42840 [Scytonematopsis contorta HA4267-MV1]|jgi:hypothetical protein|nr:hypothetical protein [Scytonematopsis contorta HA4267-MV1]